MQLHEWPFQADPFKPLTSTARVPVSKPATRHVAANDNVSTKTHQTDLTNAIRLATKAHDGQTDKAGEPYILHPLRVMLVQKTEEARIAAVLHDVVEDSDTVGLGDILAFFGEDVRAAVDALTRREGEDYFAYIARCYANPIARQVKVADLNDNMDPRRVPPGLLEHDARLRKYDRAFLILTDQTVVAA